jgi:hypothetical protein
VPRSEFCVPVAAAVDGELGDVAAADLGEEDLAVGDLFAVLLVAAGELGDEAGHGGNRADHRCVGSAGHETLDPGIEGVTAAELEAPEGRVPSRKTSLARTSLALAVRNTSARRSLSSCARASSMTVDSNWLMSALLQVDRSRATVRSGERWHIGRSMELFDADIGRNSESSAGEDHRFARCARTLAFRTFARSAADLFLEDR